MYFFDVYVKNTRTKAINRWTWSADSKEDCKAQIEQQFPFLEVIDVFEAQ